MFGSICPSVCPFVYTALFNTVKSLSVFVSNQGMSAVSLSQWLVTFNFKINLLKYF